MLEGLQIVQRALGEEGERACVDLVAGDGQHESAFVDEAGEHGHQQVRLQAELDRREVFDVGRPAEQLAAVDDLPVPLGLESIQDLLGIAGAGRLDAVAVQHLQGIQHGDRVPGSASAGEPA